MIAPLLASHARKEAAQPLSAAAGVGQILQDGFELELILPSFTADIGGQVLQDALEQ